MSKTLFFIFFIIVLTVSFDYYKYEDIEPVVSQQKTTSIVPNLGATDLVLAILLLDLVLSNGTLTSSSTLLLFFSITKDFLDFNFSGFFSSTTGSVGGGGKATGVLFFSGDLAFSGVWDTLL